jgi:BMFP domain-containing protein YqiC
MKDFRQKGVGPEGFGFGDGSRFLDDIARVAGGAVNVLSGLQQQMRDEIHARIDEVAGKLDLVPRKELDMANAAIAKLRGQLADLEKRVAAMEGKPAAAAKAKKKPVAKPAKKTAKKTGKKK